MPFAHVAHDCMVGNDNIFANLAALAGHVHVGNNVTIGGITTVHQHCKLGDFCFAGMNSSITMDVPAYVKVASDPARVIGINSVGMSRHTYRIYSNHPCLLYTSPSPRDKRQSRMPSSA